MRRITFSPCIPALALALGLGLLLLAGCAAPAGGTGSSASGTTEDPPAASGTTSTSAPGRATSTPAPSGATSAPSGGTSAAALGAELRISVDDRAGGRHTYTLTCDPPGGDHPDPAAACAALAAAGLDVFEPPPPDLACTQIYGGPQTATVTGTVSGTPINSSFSRTDGCQIARWDALTPLLTGGGA